MRNFSFDLVFLKEEVYFTKAMKILVATIALTSISGVAFALPAGSPYLSILERNIFGLNPPPPPATNNAAAVEPPPTIKFTGITTLGNEKKAWFIVQSKDPKEAPAYLSLPEGQRSGPLEVRKILEDTGEVKVFTDGKELTLSFKEHGNKANVVALPSGGPAPVPGAIPKVPPPGVPAPGVPSYGAAGAPIGSAPVQAFNPAGNSPANYAANSSDNLTTGLRSIPTRSLRTQPTPPPTENQGPQMTAEEQVLLHEANRIINQPAVEQGLLPPVPSVFDGPSGGGGTSPGGQQSPPSLPPSPR